jgi:enterochelin esterase-like enzyme
VGAHSPSLPEEGARDFLGEGADYVERDPISTARARPRHLLQRLRIWIDVGAEDDWRPRVEQLARVLDRRGVDSDLGILPGDHDGEYWSAHIVDYLFFYDAALNPTQASLPSP